VAKAMGMLPDLDAVSTGAVPPSKKILFSFFSHDHSKAIRKEDSNKVTNLLFMLVSYNRY
jgi:hypothetical protein